MKSDQSSKRVTRSMAKKINNESEVADPRKALFAAIQARGAKEEAPKSPEVADPRQALFAAIKNRQKKESSAEDDEGSSPSDVEYTPGVHRLQEFVNKSAAVLSLAAQDQDAAIRACKVRCRLSIAVYHGVSVSVILTTNAFHHHTGPCRLLWRRGRRTSSCTPTSSPFRVCIFAGKCRQEVRRES